MPQQKDWSQEAFGTTTDLHTVTQEEMSANLRRFYIEVAPKSNEKGGNEEYSRNTLMNIRAAINRALSDLGRSMDIVHDKIFKQANDMLNGKLKFMKRTGQLNPTEHKPLIPSPDLLKINEYLKRENDPTVLRQRVWYQLAIQYVTRALEYHQQLHLHSFIFASDEFGRKYATLKHETKAKCAQGGIKDGPMKRHSTDAPEKHMYALKEDDPRKSICPVASLQKLVEKTDPSASALFNHLKPNCHYWYKAKHVGERQFRNFMPDICRAAGIRRYTAHSLRATAITALSDSGVELRHIMFMSGHNQEASVRSYNRDTSTTQKQVISGILSELAAGPSDTSAGPSDTGAGPSTKCSSAIDVSPHNSAVSVPLPASLALHNVTNCQFNINIVHDH